MIRFQKTPKGKSAAVALPDISLEGFRIFLRPPCTKDWQQWAQVRGENRDHLEPYEPRWVEDCLSEDFFRRRLKRQSYDWQIERACSFLIFKKQEDVLIGGMNINNICRGAAQYASLGYWIDRDHQGQGYMSEALRLTVQYCFEELKLHRIHAACIPDNERSKNLLLRGGFSEEGFAKRYLQINGTWQDHVLFSLIRGEI